jgi:hypothetical protein
MNIWYPLIYINIHWYTVHYCTMLWTKRERCFGWSFGCELRLRMVTTKPSFFAAAYCSILQHTAASWELWEYMRHLETNWLNRVLYYSILPASELQKQRLVIQWLSVLLCVFHFAWTSKFPKLGFHDASARRTICDGSCRKCQAETFAMASAVLRSDRFSFLTSLVIPQAEAAKDSWHL